MYDNPITPEQGAELLAQAENGEFDLDNLSDDSQEQADDVDGQDDEQDKPQSDEKPQETQPQEQTQPLVDYMAILAQERAEKLALQEQLAKYQTEQPKNTEQEPPKQEVSLEELFGDFDEKGIKNAVDYLVQQKLEQVLAEKLTPIEQKQAQDAYQEHINAITSVHPDAGQIVNSDEFTNWVKSQPSYIQPSIVNVVEQGSSEQVNELLTNYKASIAPQTPNPTQDVKTRAEQVVADAKPTVPNSLSELGGANQTDPMQALANMSGAQALGVLQGMTQEQIDNYLNRL